MRRRANVVEIYSGEWGYTATAVSPEVQGTYIARMYLSNLVAGVPLTIWYDWHDDGTDPKEGEHHFGTTLHEYREDKDLVYDPKPAYLAARTVSSALKGFKVEGGSIPTRRMTLWWF